MSPRPTTSTLRRPPDAMAGRALLRGMSAGPAPYAIEFDGRTVYDFLISLGVEDPGEHDLLPGDRRWLEAARASLSPDRKADLEACFGHEAKAFCDAVGALAVLTPGARDAREFIAALAVLDSRAAVREMLGELRRDPEQAERLERVLAGARDEIPVFAAHSGEAHDEAVAELLSSPTAWIDRIRGLLGEWVGRFEEIEPRIERMIRRDLELRATERASLPPEELVGRGRRRAGDPQPELLRPAVQLRLCRAGLATVRLSARGCRARHGRRNRAAAGPGAPAPGPW